MANKIAAIKISLSFVDENDAQQSLSHTTTVPYNSETRGELDVPDTTAATTDLAIPFGGVATDASLAWVENKTGQALKLKVNGGASQVSLAAGASILVAAPGQNADTKLTALHVVLTAEQVGDGKVAYKIFGDPSA